MSADERMKPEEIEQALRQFTGSESVYGHWMGFVYTEGVERMADMCQAFWLIDAVGSWQTDKKVRAEEFQAWKLTVKDRSAVLTCDDGNGRIVARQEIEYTDFPLKEVSVWFENRTLYLPSER